MDPVAQGYDYNYLSGNGVVSVTVTARAGVPAPGNQTLMISSSSVGTTNYMAMKSNFFANFPCYCQPPPFCNQSSSPTNNIAALVSVQQTLQSLLIQPPQTCPFNFNLNGLYTTCVGCNAASNNCGHFVSALIYVVLINRKCSFMTAGNPPPTLSINPNIAPPGCVSFYLYSSDFGTNPSICTASPWIWKSNRNKNWWLCLQFHPQWCICSRLHKTQITQPSLRT